MAASDDGLGADMLHLFRCFICLSRLKCAVMCPACSKMGCGVCMRRWITEQRHECPHCRAHLAVSQLVQCRFMDELQTQVEDLAGKKSDQRDICADHGTHISYFCRTCETPICSDCAMFDDKHKGHAFDRLQTKYDEQVNLLAHQLTAIKTNLETFTTVMSKIENNVLAVENSRQEADNEVEFMAKQAYQKLEAQFCHKLTLLIGQKTSILSYMRQLQATSARISEVIDSGSQVSLIDQSAELVSAAEKLASTPEQIENLDPISTLYSTVMIPQYEVMTVMVYQYSSYEKAETLFLSNSFLMSGLLWRLKIYPGGNGHATKSYLSIFVELMEGPGEPDEYQYRLQLINARYRDSQEHNVVREFSSKFEVGECWGYNKFFPLDMLKSEGFLDYGDRLEVRFHVRPLTYYQKAQSMKWYSEKLTRDVKIKEARIHELENENMKLRRELRAKQSQCAVSPTQLSLSPKLLNTSDTIFTPSTVFTTEIMKENADRVVLQTPHSVGSIVQKMLNTSRTPSPVQPDSKQKDSLQKIMTPALSAHKENENENDSHDKCPINSCIGSSSSRPTMTSSSILARNHIDDTSSDFDMSNIYRRSLVSTSLPTRIPVLTTNTSSRPTSIELQASLLQLNAERDCSISAMNTLNAAQHRSISENEDVSLSLVSSMYERLSTLQHSLSHAAADLAGIRDRTSLSSLVNTEHTSFSQTTRRQQQRLDDHTNFANTWKSSLSSDVPSSPLRRLQLYRHGEGRGTNNDLYHRLRMSPTNISLSPSRHHTTLPKNTTATRSLEALFQSSYNLGHGSMLFNCDDNNLRYVDSSEEGSHQHSDDSQPDEDESDTESHYESETAIDEEELEYDSNENYDVSADSLAGLCDFAVNGSNNGTLLAEDNEKDDTYNPSELYTLPTMPSIAQSLYRFNVDDWITQTVLNEE